VTLVGDDPGAKSSSVPCASEAALADLAIPTLYPADSQDVLDFGLHAQFLSRFSGLWSALKIATAVADATATAVVARDTITITEGNTGLSAHRPSSMLLGENLMALERSLHDVRLPRAVEYARLNGLPGGRAANRHPARPARRPRAPMSPHPGGRLSALVAVPLAGCRTPRQPRSSRRRRMTAGR
jgi:indolepyruvate ferredoxin oxidoreductase